MDEIVYEEQQTAIWFLWIVAVIVTADLVLWQQIGEKANLHEKTVVLLTSAVAIAGLLLMHRMTITLTARELRWRYTWISFPGWRIPLTDIRRVEVTKSVWIEGWGIRYTTTGMLYNVSGTQAIRLHLKNGKTLRLGSQQPGHWYSLLQARTGPGAGIAGNRYG